MKSISSYQLKVIHTNRRGEYMKEFHNYLKKNDITYEITALYLLEQNGKVERVNCTIMDLVQVVLA